MRSHTAPRTAIAILVAMLAIAVAPGIAQATKRYSSSISAGVSNNKKAFEGTVFSNPVCLPSRQVTVFNAFGAIVGSDNTNNNGKWRVNVSGTVPPGFYAAEVGKRVFRQNGKKRVCRSASITFSVLP